MMTDSIGSNINFFPCVNYSILARGIHCMYTKISNIKQKKRERKENITNLSTKI